MPEEIAIALIILVAAGWIIVKVVQALARALDNTQKGAIQAISQRNEARYLQKKLRISRHVTFLLPNQLESAAKQIELAEVRLERSKLATQWAARRPSWTREEFKPYEAPPQHETYEEMNADEIQSILLPNARTWLDEEAALIARECQYPSDPPIKNSLDFKTVATVALELDSAVFEYDKSSLTERSSDISPLSGEPSTRTTGDAPN